MYTVQVVPEPRDIFSMYQGMICVQTTLCRLLASSDTTPPVRVYYDKCKLRTKAF